MCAVSMVGDYWRDQLPQKPYYPGIQPHLNPPYLYQPLAPLGNPLSQSLVVTRAEFDQLKRDVEELKKLLTAAKKYDEAVGEPDCEVEDKVALIKKVAKLVGVSMDEIFGKDAG